MNDFRKLPERIDPRRQAVSGGAVSGPLALAGMTRLAECWAPGETPGKARAALDLRFDEDDQRRIRITGRVRATLVLQCQRCLEPFEWTVDQPLRLVAVADEDAAAGVPRDWEPVIVPEGGLEPAALAEDELLLALPLAARCERPACLRAGP